MVKNRYINIVKFITFPTWKIYVFRWKLQTRRVNIDKGWEISKKIYINFKFNHQNELCTVYIQKTSVYVCINIRFVLNNMISTIFCCNSRMRFMFCKFLYALKKFNNNINNSDTHNRNDLFIKIYPSALFDYIDLRHSYYNNHCSYLLFLYIYIYLIYLNNSI